MKLLLWFFMSLSSIFLFISCVTETINSDGSIQKTDIDKAKLANTYIDLAVEYQKHNAPQVALDRVNLAIKTDDSIAKAYMIRAMIYQHLKLFSPAEKDFQEAIKLGGGNYSDVFVNYGVYLCKQMRESEGIVNFDKALQNPAYYHPELVYYNRGNCYQSLHMSESAIADYLRSITFHNPPQDSYLELAKLNYQLHKYEVANYYINQFTGAQTPSTMWLHIEILAGLMNQNPYRAREYMVYLDTIGKLLITNYANDPSTKLYLKMKQNSSVRVVNKNPQIVNNKISIKKTTNQRDIKKVIVQKNDTLFSIAHKYNVSIDTIKTLNKLTDNNVKIGDILYLSN